MSAIVQRIIPSHFRFIQSFHIFFLEYQTSYTNYIEKPLIFFVRYGDGLKGSYTMLLWNLWDMTDPNYVNFKKWYNYSRRGDHQTGTRQKLHLHIKEFQTEWNNHGMSLRTSVWKSDAYFFFFNPYKSLVSAIRQLPV